MTTADGLFLPARAKVNLILRIVGRRRDGYHLLETLFHALELHDDLWVGPAAAGVALRVTADRPEWCVEAGPQNLVVRALQTLAAAAARPAGFAAHLHKRIPHGAGLGGGSSDAAAALRLGNELLGRPLDDASLARLAAGLGADVPFFLRGGSQWGSGVGDQLAPACVAPMHFVLLVPPYGCPTAEVYGNHAALWQSGRPQARLRSVTGPHTRDSAVRNGFCNDLEEAAEQVRPALAGLRRRIVDCGYPDVRMTGSGSTLFLAFSDASDAAQCAEHLSGLEATGVRVVATRSAGSEIDIPVRLARPPG